MLQLVVAIALPGLLTRGHNSPSASFGMLASHHLMGSLQELAGI
jgi:hypothetical protein